MEFRIEHREIEGGIVVVTLAGRVMLGQESQQIETLTADLLARGYRKLVFDMGGITHMDSTGIGRFISSFNKVMQAGAKMHMAGATGVVREGFKVTRLDTVFKFFPDLESAARALA
jgi:anti-sigma B factor antagonist